MSKIRIYERLKSDNYRVLFHEHNLDIFSIYRAEMKFPTDCEVPTDFHDSHPTKGEDGDSQTAPIANGHLNTSGLFYMNIYLISASG